MRTTVTITYEDGIVDSKEVESTIVPDDVEGFLGTSGLAYIEFVHQNGRKVRYTAWEYECNFCEQYGHHVEDGDCPHYNALPKDEQEAFIWRS